MTRGALKSVNLVNIDDPERSCCAMTDHQPSGLFAVYEDNPLAQLIGCLTCRR
jgi:hypothetical protein